MSMRKTPDRSDKLKGSIKEAIGKLIGDETVEAEGKAQQKPPKSAVQPKVRSGS